MSRQSGPMHRPDQRTIFDTPLVATLLRAFSVGWLRWRGWKVEGALQPDAARSVVIAAPHTSNWDLPYTLMAAFALGMHVRWMGKASLFRGPFGVPMRWLGGIAVDRSRSTGLVAASAAALAEPGGPWQLVVPPEGTRGRTRHWKTGFWHIAREARVPIVLAYLDFGRKACGLGPVLVPGDDVEADLAIVKAFYAPMKGLRPDLFDQS
jgi:1-acyl-sn-glycerol-3-phosphate acyltransferase